MTLSTESTRSLLSLAIITSWNTLSSRIEPRERLVSWLWSSVIPVLLDPRLMFSRSLFSTSCRAK